MTFVGVVLCALSGLVIGIAVCVRGIILIRGVVDWMFGMVVVAATAGSNHRPRPPVGVYTTGACTLISGA